MAASLLPPPPPVRAPIFIAQNRVQDSHCSSILVDLCFILANSRALALSGDGVRLREKCTCILDTSRDSSSGGTANRVTVYYTARLQSHRHTLLCWYMVHTPGHKHSHCSSILRRILPTRACSRTCGNGSRLRKHERLCTAAEFRIPSQPTR